MDTEFTRDQWLATSFFMNFKTSFEIDSFSKTTEERIQQNPINGSQSKYTLYLRFEGKQ